MTASAALHIDRRLSPRFPPKAIVKAVCRKGTAELGPNLTMAVLDISQTGVRLVVSESLDPGRRLYVHFEGTVQSRPIMRSGAVVWSVPTAEGACCVGVQFQKPLNPGDLTSLT